MFEESHHSSFDIKIQNGLPCHIARWSMFPNMHWTAMNFHLCSLEHEKYYLDTFQCAHGKSSVERKPELHPKNFKR